MGVRLDQTEHFRLTAKMKEQLSSLAAKYNVSNGEVVRWALADLFAREARSAEVGGPVAFSFLAGPPTDRRPC